MKINPRFVLVLLTASPGVLLAGCSSIGDTNPTSPEKMEEIRQKQSQERANFKPSDTRSPGTASR